MLEISKCLLLRSLWSRCQKFTIFLFVLAICNTPKSRFPSQGVQKLSFHQLDSTIEFFSYGSLCVACRELSLSPTSSHLPDDEIGHLPKVRFPLKAYSHNLSIRRLQAYHYAADGVWSYHHTTEWTTHSPALSAPLEAHAGTSNSIIENSLRCHPLGSGKL